MNWMKPVAVTAVAVSFANAGYVWNSVQNWGGGYVPGVTFTSTGQAYIRTDVGGAYAWDVSAQVWNPLNDAFTSGNDMGSIAFGVDSENESYVYTTGGLYTNVSWCSAASVFRSADAGKSWTKLPLNSKTVSGTVSSVLTSNGAVCLGGNGEGRGMGNRLAVKDSVVYLGTNQNGLLKSTNRGTSWTTISDFSNTSGISAVAFDANGNVYAAPYAGGLYKSTNGSSFTRVASTFTGVVYQMSVAGDVIWITSNASNSMDQNNASGGRVYKYSVSAGTISEVTMPSACPGKSVGYLGISSIGDGKTTVVSTAGCWGGTGGPSSASFVPHEYMFYTKNGGSTWTEIMRNGNFDAASAHSNATSNPHWISAVGINPKNADHIIFGTGYGVWSTENATAASPTWKFTDKGIEETVPLAYVSTTSGAPLVSVVGDIDGYYHTDLDTPMETRHQIEAGTNYDLDYAGLVPTKMIRIYKEATKGLGAVSVDGGKTWTPFTTDTSALPKWTVNQNAGPSTYTNENNFAAISGDGKTIVWNMAGNGVYYSTNDGNSWTKASDVVSDDVSGFHVVSDKKAAGTFYIYSGKVGKLYRSTDSGKSWTVVNSTMATLSDYAYGKARLFASPDAEGDLWAVQGVNIGGVVWTGTSVEGVFHSKDGGSTFSKVSGLAYAAYIGFGKGKSTASAIYAAGMANTSNPINSIYRSDDGGSTWTDIGDAEHRYGEITMVVGDPCIYSRIYLAGSGRGMIYAQEPGNENVCPERIDYKKTTVVKPQTLNITILRFSVSQGMMNVHFLAENAGMAKISVTNSLGQIVATQTVNVSRGQNSAVLHTPMHGTGVLMVQQGSLKTVKAVRF